MKNDGNIIEKHTYIFHKGQYLGGEIINHLTSGLFWLNFSVENVEKK